MDDAGPVGADRLGQRAEVKRQGVGERAVGLPAAGVHGETRGLVDHEQDLVLVDDDEREVLRLDRQGPRRRDADLDRLAAGDLRLAGERPAVDQDETVGDPAREHRATVLGQRQRERTVEAGALGIRIQAESQGPGGIRGVVDEGLLLHAPTRRRRGAARTGIRDGPAVAVPRPAPHTVRGGSRLGIVVPSRPSPGRSSVARKHVPPADKSSSSWKPLVAVGAGVVVLLVVGLLVFWPDIDLSMTINQLHSDDPAVRKAARAKLTESERPDLDAQLEEVLNDPDKAFNVRTQIGSVLIQRGRMPAVERAMASEDLQSRMVALAVLDAHQHLIPEAGDVWFKRDVAENPDYRVTETLLAWLAREGDLSRLQGVQIATELGLQEAIPLLRKLATPPRDGTLSRNERGLISVAANALVRFEDCESMPGLLETAKTSADERVRLRLTQVVYQAVSGGQGVCKDAVPEEAVKEMVVRGLDGAAEVKQGSLLILSQRPEWARDVADRLLAILDGAEGDNVYVRRGALGALTAVGDEAFGRRLPRYFHADDFNIRSQAVSGSRAYALKPGFEDFFEGCWLGVLRDETESNLAFDSALGGLRDRAGTIVGVPDAVMADPQGRSERMVAFRKELYEEGESYGLDRVTWVDTWFDWWAKQLGLESQAERDAALAARRAFWDAARAGDVAGARQALASVPSGDGPLFTYEQGWLEAR